MTIFVFYLFWELVPDYFLFQRAIGICLEKKYPFLIGAVTGVSCVPEWMLMQQCVDVFQCVSVRKEWQWLLLYSLVIFFFLMPHFEDKYSYINTFCHSPADNWVCCLCQQEWERQNTWCEHATRTRISTKSKKLSFLPQCWELLCALLFCLTGPHLIWTKKVWESPLEVLCGYDVTSKILCALWATPEELLHTVGAFKGTAVLTQSVTCNIPLVIDWHNATLHRSFFPGWSGFGDTSP